MGNDVIRTVQGYPVHQNGYVPRRAVAVQHLAQWKNDPDHVDAWLCKLIGSAFQSFVIRALRGQPAAEMLPLTAALWVSDLLDMKLTEEQDKGRIETALRSLNRKLKEWPQVAMLIEELPRREAPSAAANVVRTRTVEEEALADKAMADVMAEMREKGLFK